MCMVGGNCATSSSFRVAASEVTATWVGALSSVWNSEATACARDDATDDTYDRMLGYGNKLQHSHPPRLSSGVVSPVDVDRKPAPAEVLVNYERCSCCNFTPAPSCSLHCVDVRR